MAIGHVAITDDRMFKRVFGDDKELCKRLVELSLNEPIAQVEFVEAQHESSDPGRPGGAYLDVLATTEDGQTIDIEMQTQQTKSLARRARLYEGRMTCDAWSTIRSEKDTYDFSLIPNAAVIFICDFDPVGNKLRRYTGRMMFEETGGPVDDGTVFVLLNAQGEGDDLPPDLAAFLRYIRTDRFDPGKSAFVDRVARRVEEVNSDARFREGLMNLDERFWRERQEGIDEGRKQGIEEGSKQRGEQVAELTRRMRADGRTAELLDALEDPDMLARELERYGIG